MVDANAIFNALGAISLLGFSYGIGSVLYAIVALEDVENNINRARGPNDARRAVNGFSQFCFLARPSGS